MRGPLRLRALSEEEARVIKKLAHSRTASARLVQRAQIIELAHEGCTIPPDGAPASGERTDGAQVVEAL
jgi:hypothetical protein